MGADKQELINQLWIWFMELEVEFTVGIENITPYLLLIHIPWPNPV
jgi:hypothetical protein